MPKFQASSKSFEFLEALDPTRFLVEIIQDFPKEYNESLISSILEGEKIPSLSKILLNEYTEVSYKFFAPEDLAFQWLCDQEPAWLNAYSSIIEKTWLNCCTREDEKQQNCYARIKELVDKTKAGLSIPFLEQLLSNNTLKDVQVEVDNYLLWVKLQEKALPTNAGLWEELVKKVQDDKELKPYLVLILAYLHRKICPEEFEDQVLWYIIYERENIEKHYLNHFQSLRPYFVSYFKQWIFNYFNVITSVKATRFIRVIDEKIAPGWITDLFTEIWKDPHLQVIKAEIEQKGSNVSDSIRKIEEIASIAIDI